MKSLDRIPAALLVALLCSPLLASCRDAAAPADAPAASTVEREPSASDAGTTPDTASADAASGSEVAADSGSANAPEPLASAADMNRPTPTAEPDAAAPALPEGCLGDAPGLAHYVNADEGYCLQYPSTLDLNRAGVGSGQRALAIAHTPANRNQPESISANLTIELSAVDADADLATLVADRLAPYAEMMGGREPVEAEIAGQPALRIDGVPGIYPSRQAYLLHGGDLVMLSLVPWQDPAQPDLQAESERLWDVVVGSLQFYERSTETP